jgi:8-oxo-dGTP diphosphatase
MHNAYMYVAYMQKVSKPRSSPEVKAAPDSEEAFLATYDIRQFERPSVAVDVVVLTVEKGALRVVVYQRKEHPARGKYALPGGFVRIDESLDDAARRLLRDKARLEGVFFEQLYTFGEPGRDPRGRIITVAYLALVAPEVLAGVARTHGARVCAVRVGWRGVTGGAAGLADEEGRSLPIAFDHGLILGAAVKRLRGTLDDTPVAFQLLPRELTLRALQDVHEAIRGEAVNKDSFRRRMLAAGWLEATGERERDASHRPAELYRFVNREGL